MQDRTSSSFASNMIKLSVMKKMEYFASQDSLFSYSFYFDLNIWFRARQVMGTLDWTGPSGLLSKASRRNLLEK